MSIKFNLQPKVTGVGTFTPPEGYEKINGEWVKVKTEDPKVSDDNSSNISEESEDQ